MDIDRLLSDLTDFDALRSGDRVESGSVDRIKPQYVESWPVGVHSSIRNALIDMGITRPYLHQDKAIRLALNGRNVVMEAPTASGKTLAFAVPMLNRLVKDYRAHALLIYPMKALAFDQRAQIYDLCRGISGPREIQSWPYDGNESQENRNALRSSPPPILMTNPEYLNMSFLAYREQWETFLRNLKYIVIDEMHEYRGFFGSNVALLLRRFLLHLKRLGVSPQVFMATATCANPKEHAKALTGLDMELVQARQVFSPTRQFVFVDPSIPDFRYRDILRLRVEQAALACLSQGLQALIFCPTKRFLEDAFRHTRQKALDQEMDTDSISLFHADLIPDKRREIQERVKSGDIRIVFSTNALELGLDIGGLDGVILAGFPSNLMSAWQQIGRAGRSWEKDAFVLFYSMNDPIDRFFVSNLSAFLNKPYDQLVVDPNNEELIERHLPSLIEETSGRLRPADLLTLGQGLYEAARTSGGTPVSGFKPQRGLDLRGGIGQSLKLVSGRQEIGQISETRKFREAYIGAIFPFMGMKYQVQSHEEDKVVLVGAEPHMRTDPGFFTASYITKVFDGQVFTGEAEVYYGQIDISTNFTGYKLVDERSGDEIRSGGTSNALNHRNLHAFWIEVLEQTDAATEGLVALEHLLRVGSMFVIPADRFDASTLSKKSDMKAFYYENYTGGIGVAKQLFSVWQAALGQGIKVAEGCLCAHGCANCIEPPKSYRNTDDRIDKRLGIALARRLIDAAKNGPDREFRDGMMMPVQRR